MEKEELKNKLDEYTVRNNFWTDKAINQFGYSLNLFTTVGIGLLGYLVTNRNKFPEFEYIKDGDINCSLVFYYSSLVIIFISVLFGFISILSRLYDFRLTRHLALTRKRFLKRKKSKDGLINSKIIDISNDNYCKAFRKNVFGKIEFVNETHFDNGTVSSQFEELRRNSKILGAVSWKAHKIQIVFFVIGILVIGFSVI
ncbi:MAG: hypothetical protein DRJ01_08420 [Bacteroidetes bacterium]|nr:MAG: hypothetical protein DRJ01_08420 [Bacteroidota bacterium]